MREALPFFPGHQQPRSPSASFSYYDPRDAAVRDMQAAYALRSGVEGFCYWHMWFGGGKKLLHEPVEALLKTGRPDMPFCLAWANQTWTRTWARSNRKGEVLAEQMYPGDEDHRAHFAYLLPFFRDRRYLCVDGKPVFVIYMPEHLPDAGRVLALWRTWAQQAGLPGLYIVACRRKNVPRDALEHFDAYIVHQPRALLTQYGKSCVRKVLSGNPLPLLRCLGGLRSRPQVFDAAEIVRVLTETKYAEQELPHIVTCWDDTPRHGSNGTVITGDEGPLFALQLRAALSAVQKRAAEQRIIFLKSWNEWGEGNIVEPDTERGDLFSDILRRHLLSS